MPSTNTSSWRERFFRDQPEFPWLAPGDPESIEAFLRERGFLADGQKVLACTAAGAGNMNLTLRIETSRGSLVLKQARPWVEKYEHIRAPWDRDAAERNFYESAARIADLAPRIPKLLGSDPSAHVLLIEDLVGASDLTTLYRNEGERLPENELDELAEFLSVLHRERNTASDTPFLNQAMRELNFAHLFEDPFDDKNGVNLEELETGFLKQAQEFRRDENLRGALREIGTHYMKPGSSVLHGDFFPGSWLRTPKGIRIIDFEFSFQGEPEIDIGCAVAHLALGGQTMRETQRFVSAYLRDGAAPRIDTAWIGRYAGVEVARRLIGVAQLPLPVGSPGSKRRCDLLQRASGAILKGRVESLFEAVS